MIANVWHPTAEWEDIDVISVTPGRALLIATLKAYLGVQEGE